MFLGLKRRPKLDFKFLSKETGALASLHTFRMRKPPACGFSGSDQHRLSLSSGPCPGPL